MFAIHFRYCNDSIYCFLYFSFFPNEANKLLQIMLSVASTFIHAILTAHSYSQFILQKENYAIEITLLQSGWFLLYSSITLVIFYCSSRLKDEVIQIPIKIQANKQNKSQSFKKNYFQGKRTFRLVHDVIICCDDSDVIQLVRRNGFDFQYSFQKLYKLNVPCVLYVYFIAGPIVSTDTAS